MVISYPPGLGVAGNPGYFPSSAPAYDGGGVSGFVTNSQSFEIDLPIFTATANATIDAVDLNKSLLLFHGNRVAVFDSVASRTFANLLPVDSTTVRARRDTTSNIASLARGMMVSGTSNLFQFVEYGEASVSGSTDTEPLTNTFDTATSFVVYLGQRSGTSSSAEITANVRLTGPSQLTFQRGTGFSTTQIAFVVCQLQPKIVKFTQQIVTDVFLTDIPLGQTVDPDNTLCFWGNQTVNTSGSAASTFIEGHLLNSTTFQFSVNSLKGARVHLVEFVNGVMAQPVQRGQTTIVTLTSETTVALSSPIKKGKALLNYIGFSTNDGSASPNFQYDDFLPTIEFGTSGGDPTVFDEVTVKRGTAATETVTVSWEAAEFK